MKKQSAKANQNVSDAHGTNVRLADIANLISSIARLYRTGPLSDPELAYEIDKIVSIFRRYANLSVVEFEALFAQLKDERKSLAQAKHPNTNAPDWERVSTISLAECRKLLGDKDLTKNDLLKLASMRFGLPTGNLKKLRRELIVTEIRNRIEHEESINILSHEASKGAAKRTS